jgi:(S)-sulfolactate dehydrogenase
MMPHRSAVAPMSTRRDVARVLITEPVNAPLTPLAGLEIDDREGLWRDRAGLLDAVKSCAALIVRNQTRVDEELIQGAPALRVVGRLGAGMDNLDLDALRSRSIAVVHGGGLNARAVAEYVIGACLALARGLVRSDAEVRRGEWLRHVGFELRGQSLGVVGLGATGAETARLALSLGMNVTGHDPLLAPPAGVEGLSLDDLLSRSRIVSVHVPLNEATRGLLSAAEFARMPKGSLVINAARGGVVDEAALIAALDSGHLAGAAMDVRSEEPPRSGDPFANRNDVLLTAHIAGLTTESQAAIAHHVLTGVREALT